jgi:hypothetical protein
MAEFPQHPGVRKPPDVLSAVIIQAIYDVVWQALEDYERDQRRKTMSAIARRRR